jgi:hypothetical protein
VFLRRLGPREANSKLTHFNADAFERNLLPVRSLRRLDKLQDKYLIPASRRANG